MAVLASSPSSALPDNVKGSVLINLAYLHLSLHKWTENKNSYLLCIGKKIPAVEEKTGKQSTAPVAVKKWTKEDEAASKIQKYVRRFLAKRQLAKRKKERAAYEELMDKLEKEVFC